MEERWTKKSFPGQDRIIFVEDGSFLYQRLEPAKESYVLGLLNPIK